MFSQDKCCTKLLNDASRVEVICVVAFLSSITAAVTTSLSQVSRGQMSPAPVGGPTDSDNLQPCCLLFPVVWVNQALHHMSARRNVCIRRDREVECGRVPCLFVVLARVLGKRLLFGLNHPEILSGSQWEMGLSRGRRSRGTQYMWCARLPSLIPMRIQKHWSGDNCGDIIRATFPHWL